MKNIAIIIQILLGIMLIVAVLFQSASGGIGSILGGGDTYHTKRGVEKGLFYLTIILAVLFTLISILALAL